MDWSNRDILIFGLGGFTAILSIACYHRIKAKGLKQIVHKEWKTGENQPIPFDNKSYKSWTPAELRSGGGLYPFVISAVVPRPIALVVSISKSGILNCAPFSYFNVISHDPPLVAIGLCINGRTKTKKDTLNNIEETGQFVVNIMSSWYVDSANHTCGNFPPEENEMILAGLTNIKSDLVTPPRVGEAAVQLECEVY